MKIPTLLLLVMLVVLSLLYFHIKHPISYLLVIPIMFISGELGFRYAQYTDRRK